MAIDLKAEYEMLLCFQKACHASASQDGEMERLHGFDANYAILIFLKNSLSLASCIVTRALKVTLVGWALWSIG
jgi:hypothetical protein